MDEATLGSYRSLKHPLISVFLPFGFIWLVTACLRAALPSSLGRIPGVYPLLLLIAAVSETAVGSYIESKKSQGILPRMRELVLLLLFSYFFIKLTGGDIFRGDWTLARFDLIVAILLVVIEWLFCFFIHSALRERELLLGLVASRARAELKESFRDLGTEAANSLAGMLRVRRFIIAFQVIAFLALFVLGIALPASLSFAIALLGLLHFLGGIVALFTITGYMERQALMGDGFTMSEELSGRRAAFAVVLCAVACIALVPLVGRDAPLPSSYLRSFVEWLQRILTLPESDRKAVYNMGETTTPTMDMGDKGDMLGGLGEGAPMNETLQRILRLVIFILVIGGPGGVLIGLLVAPLFRRHQERPHPLRALRGWLARAARALAQGMRGFLSSVRSLPRVAREGGGLRELLFGRTRAEDSAQAEGRSGFLRRLSLSREVRVFVKIIRWGEKRGARFHRSLGPREYAGSLGASSPELRSELDALAEILEEILFSGRGIAPERSERYFEAARIVLRHR